METKYSTANGKLSLECDKVSVFALVNVAEAMIREARKLMDQKGLELTGVDRAAYEDADANLDNIETEIMNLDGLIDGHESECAFYYDNASA
jgi:hypothetical protein